MNDVLGVALFLALFASVALFDVVRRRHDRKAELDAYERMVSGGWG